MYVLVLLIAVVLIFQVSIIGWAWMHRRDPLLLLPKQQRVQVLIDLLKVRNALRSVDLFSKALMSKSFGTLNLSQKEFIHQIHKVSAEAESTLDMLVDPGQPLSLDAPPHAENQVQTHRTFTPEAHSILQYIHSEQEPPLDDQIL